MPSPIREFFQRIPAKIRTGFSSLLKVVITVLAFYILFSHQVQMIDHRPVQLEDGKIINLVRGDSITYGSQTVTLVNATKARDEHGADIALKDGHPVRLNDGRHGRISALETESTFEAIRSFLPKIRARTFWTFVVMAALVKFLGILSSMYRWHLLLKGQGIRFPFRHLFGSFLIGRFLGTFLPSTIGLDGYKLYDASRFSRRTVECTAATIIEKTLGIVGLFITFLVTLPFGRTILGEKAADISLLTVPIAASVITAFFLLLFYPAIIQWFITHIPLPGKNRIHGFINRVNHAAAAYRDKKLLLVNAAIMSFLVHFLTAAMYFYTALAIGAVGAKFWQVTFASSIQIFATVITPITIAGEGIREIAQYYLLRNQLGPAEAIVSAALGFWAAEALTLLGAFYWWFRKKSYKPAYLYLDGKPADLDNLLGSDDYGLEELRLVSKETRSKGWMRQAFFTRVCSGAAGGMLAGVLLGLVESLWTGIAKGADNDLFIYGMMMYGLIGVTVGIGIGTLTGMVALAFGRIKGSVNTFALTFSGWMAINTLILGRFLLNRDLYKEQGVPKISLLVLLLFAGVIFFGGTIWGRFESRRRDVWAKKPILWSIILITTGCIYWIAAVVFTQSDPAIRRPDGIPETVADKPNILLIVCDALRADHLGCYGYLPARTPVIDTLADNAIRFHSSYSQSSWTKPAFATILSGLYPSGHKTYLKPDILPDEVVTLQETLQAAGYHTVAFPNNINVSSGFNFDQGFDEFRYLSPDYFFYADEFSSKLTYYSILRKIREGFISRSKHPRHYYQEAAVVTDHAVRFLDQQGKTSRFFLLLHYMEPHDPFFQHPFNGIGYARVSMPNPDPSLASEMRQAYDQEIAYMDHWIGVLLEKLKQNGLWEDTLIVLTADHGEEFYDHGGWWHGMTLYQELIHVPLIIRPDAGNARFLTPSIRLDNARQIDIAPTILGLARLPVPESMNLGRNLLAPGQTSESQISVYAEENHEGNILKAHIDGPWKIILANPDNPRGLPETELFRIDIDPLELNNRAAVEIEDRDRMTENLRTAESVALTGQVERREKQITDDELEKMRELGYVQ